MTKQKKKKERKKTKKQKKEEKTVRYLPGDCCKTKYKMHLLYNLNKFIMSVISLQFTILLKQ